MVRRWLIAAALMLSPVGCQNRPTQLDPFLGRTTVPPPPTGSVGTGVVVPPATGATPVAKPPIGTPPPTSPNITPPRVLSSTPSTGTPGQFVGTGGTPIRVVQPDAGARPAGSPTYTGLPGTFSAPPGGGIDIMDLPVRGKSNQPKTAGNDGRGSQQSYAPPSDGTKVVTLPGKQSVYGFNEDYTQLSGKLEYSQFDGRWLLRYVAPGSRPDTYGGAAVLVLPGPPAGLRNGDFVTAQGRFDGGGSSGSPVFTAVSIAPQQAVR